MARNGDVSVVPPSGPAAPRADSVRPTPGRELVGLWEAKHRYGPDIRGTLIVTHPNGGWRAEIAGHTAEPDLKGDTIRFGLPNGKNNFIGRFDPGGAKITGQWIQPGNCTSPITLTK